MKLTAEMVAAMPAGRELDVLCALHVMGWERPPRNQVGWVVDGEWTGLRYADWSPSTNIAEAWEVFQHCRNQLFSKRTRFIRALAGLLQKHPDMKPGTVIAWPDAMLFLTPELIVRAALLAAVEGATDA